MHLLSQMIVFILLAALPSQSLARVQGDELKTQLAPAGIFAAIHGFLLELNHRIRADEIDKLRFATATKPVGDCALCEAQPFVPNADQAKQRAYNGAAQFSYYPGTPFVTLQMHKPVSDQCLAEAKQAGGILKVYIAHANGGVEDFEIDVHPDGTLKTEAIYFGVTGKLEPTGKLNATIKTHAKTIKINKQNPIAIDQEYSCSYQKKMGVANGEPVSKQGFFSAYYFNHLAFGKHNLAQAKNMSQQQFATRDMLNVHDGASASTELRQEIMFAKDALLSICQTRISASGGASVYTDKQCESTNHGKKISPQQLFPKLDWANFKQSPLRKWLLTEQGLFETGDALYLQFVDNFYADQTGINFVFNDGALQGTRGGYETVKLTYRQLASIIDMQALGAKFD